VLPLRNFPPLEKTKLRHRKARKGLSLEDFSPSVHHGCPGNTLVGLSHGPPPAFLLDRWLLAVVTVTPLQTFFPQRCYLGLHELLNSFFTAPCDDHGPLPGIVESLLGGVELAAPGLAFNEGRESFVAAYSVWKSVCDRRRSMYAATSRNQGSDDFSVGAVNLGRSHRPATPAELRSRS